MGQLSRNVRRLRDDLRRLLNAQRPDPLEANRILDRVAEVLLRALWDDAHPLADDLVDLERRVYMERDGTL